MARIYAITQTLESRLEALNEVLRILRDPNRTAAEKKRLFGGALDPNDPRDISEYEELTDEEKQQVDKRIFRQVLTGDPAKVEEEREEVEKLHRLAESLRHHKEAKFLELLKVLDSSDVIRAEDEKLLIFTEYKDTLESLSKRLEEKGYSVTTIHGNMDVDDRKRAQREFRTRSMIMVATDAAGEGINLQFCRYLINWDIPWNPNRLEQRMGRIHRYGQRDDVWVYNLVAQNTREGAVLQKILLKMDVMREQMGSDRVYDVIDEWLEGVPLVNLIEKAIDAEDVSEASQETEEALRQASRERADHLIALQKKTSLSSKLNLKAARELRDASDEKRLQPLFIQRFFEKAWKASGGTIRKDDSFPVWYLGHTPPELIELARERRTPLSDFYETPFVFDKQLVSVASKIPVPDRTKLLGPGHPLFDVLVNWCIQKSHQAFSKGAILVDPNLATPQHVWLVRSSIQDGRIESQKRLAHEQLAVVAEDHMGLRVTSPSYFLNCVPPEDREGGILSANSQAQAGSFPSNSQAGSLPSNSQAGSFPSSSQAGSLCSNEEIQAYAYEEITEKQLARVTTARVEECDLRREYLNTAFTDLILDLQRDLNDFQQASLFGEENADERERLHRRIEELKLRKIDRMKEIDLMLNLTANIPDILTQAIVTPAPVVTIEPEKVEPLPGVPMRRDDEVEAIAMDVVMRYERSRGWSPVDVSKGGEHYDIRSESPDGEIRFIEVKGRALSGAIVLTGPEMDKLRQLGDRAWLYIVTFCKSVKDANSKPRLRIIQDPISKLTPEMLYRQIQFLVEERDWQSCGEEVD